MAILIQPDGSLEIITGQGPGGTLTYDQIREALNKGYMEVVSCDPKLNDGRDHLILDEEGKLKQLPPNPEATRRSTYTAPSDILCGPVLFCKYVKLPDGDIGSS